MVFLVRYDYNFCQGVSVVGNQIKDERINVFYDMSLIDNEHFDRFLIENDLVKNGITIWSKKRGLMLFKLLLFFSIQLLLCFAFFTVLMDSHFYYQFILEVFLTFIFSIGCHELGHILSFWYFQKEYNGYFQINTLHYEYIYTESSLKHTMIISLMGPLIGVLSLILLMIIYPIDWLVISLLILYHLLMLSPFFDDGQQVLHYVCHNRS